MTHKIEEVDALTDEEKRLDIEYQKKAITKKEYVNLPGINELPYRDRCDTRDSTEKVSRPIRDSKSHGPQKMRHSRRIVKYKIDKETLFLIATNPNKSVSEISEIRGIHRATGWRQIKKMELKKLVSSREEANKIKFMVTERGLQYLYTFHKERMDRFEEEKLREREQERQVSQ